MAFDIDRLKSELAIHGIRVTGDGKCVSYDGGTIPVTTDIRTKILQLEYEIQDHKRLYLKFLDNINDLIINARQGAGGTLSTEKMFVSALKYLKRIPFRLSREKERVWDYALRRDISSFDEHSMSRVIDHKICMDWLYRLILENRLCIRLLRIIGTPIVVQAQAQMTPAGGLDLPWDERVSPWLADKEDWDNRQKEVQSQFRYRGIGGDLYPQSENWGEFGQLPYFWGDKDEDPYKHYWNFGDNYKHTGVEK